MILVDTSVWIDHFSAAEPGLVALLNDTAVLTHPFVIGELALGSYARRNTILAQLKNLPFADVATDGEVLSFIDGQSLHGIGYVDAHLLTAARLTPGSKLWTRDKRLDAAATRLGLTELF